MKLYCVQLSTGLIFKTLQEFYYGKTGFALDLKSSGNKDINGIIITDPNQRLNITSIDFNWKESSVVADWTEGQSDDDVRGYSDARKSASDVAYDARKSASDVAYPKNPSIQGEE